MNSAPPVSEMSSLNTDSVMRRMVFVTGFARGGTSWLRDCIGSHPDIAVLPDERVVFRDIKDTDEIRDYFERETAEISESIPFIVNKAPANAPYLGTAARAFPESRFIFIIRDPRDVLVSHQRGTMAWMGGANSTVKGCMSKTQHYYSGWQDAEGLPNVMLVRYEDLHQDFFETSKRIFEFIGVSARDETLTEVYAKNNFTARTKRANVEDRSDARRKGVVGEWAQQLKKREIKWYRKSAFFSEFLRTHGYDSAPNTYANIVDAMMEAGVHFLSEEDLLARRIVSDRPNIVLQHDIDLLRKPWCVKSVKRTAAIEAERGLVAAYNFLPLDDPRYRRYRGWSQKLNLLLDRRSDSEVVTDLIKSVSSINPRAYIGLHVNACERFYPINAPEVLGEPEDLDKIRAYLRKQVQDYRDAGVDFRIATAHGYGRGKRLPNNRDTPEIATDIADLGILLFDTSIRLDLAEQASHDCSISDVGGVVKPIKLGNGFGLTDPRAYEALPPGSFLRFLTHPGNYPVDVPSTVTMRTFPRPANTRG